MKQKKWVQWHYLVKNMEMLFALFQLSDYSLELCGGCHVSHTSEIGLFKIVSESGIGAGTRRIEAVTGKAAYEVIKEEEEVLEEAAALLKSNPKDLVTKIEGLTT